MDVRVNFGDSLLNNGWPNYSTHCRLYPFLRTSVQYLIAFCSRPEAASDVISGRFVRLAVPDKYVKFHGRRLNRSREIPPNAVGCGIYDRFLNFDKCQREIVSDVISGVDVE